MRRSYVVPMRWMVIYEYEVAGGTLNLSSTKLPKPCSPWESSPSRKNPHVRTGNRTRDLMISSQKLWPLDHEAGRIMKCYNSRTENMEPVTVDALLLRYCSSSNLFLLCKEHLRTKIERSIIYSSWPRAVRQRSNPGTELGYCSGEASCLQTSIGQPAIIWNRLLSIA
jgi:hypothetical protein